MRRGVVNRRNAHMKHVALPGPCFRLGTAEKGRKGLLAAQRQESKFEEQSATIHGSPGGLTAGILKAKRK